MKWEKIKVVLLVWFGIGFGTGTLETLSERLDHYSGGHFVEGTNGCQYESFISVLSPGHVFACELFRKRFDYDGIEKVFKKGDK